MRFAILAAGEGARLRSEGIAVPKPLVRLGGKTLLERLVDTFNRCGASEICIIINALHPETEAHARALQLRSSGAPLRLVQQTTGGSMESFLALSPLLEGEPFCMTTVDTVFCPEAFQQYIAAFRAGGDEALMAVTPYVDDERPLYVATDNRLRVTGFLDSPTPACRYISGGIYALPAAALATLRRCAARGQRRMRDFQRALLSEGMPVRAYPLGKVVDIDHASDIAVAEALLQGSAAE